MKYTCPKCNREIELSDEQLLEMSYTVTCPGCGSTLKIAGDYAYIPLSETDNSFDTDPTPPPFEPEVEEVAPPERDPLYDNAIEFAASCNALTIPMLQNYFGIDSERAAALMHDLEEGGIVAPFTGGPRKILIPHNEGLATSSRYRNFEAEQQMKELLEQQAEQGPTRGCSCSSPSCLSVIIIATLLYFAFHFIK